MKPRIVNSLAATHVGQLCHLYQNEFWCQGRKLTDINKMLAYSDLVFAALDEHDNLIGFARLLTDFTYKAVLFDLIVAPAARQQGIGKLIMDTIITHPALATVEHIDLQCLPAMFEFYRRWGFSEDLRGINMMRRQHKATTN